MKKYSYLYRLRPPGIGMQPDGYVSLSFKPAKKNGWNYHGRAVYDRLLTDEECWIYDLELETEEQGD